MAPSRRLMRGSVVLTIALTLVFSALISIETARAAPGDFTATGSISVDR